MPGRRTLARLGPVGAGIAEARRAALLDVGRMKRGVCPEAVVGSPTRVPVMLLRGTPRAICCPGGIVDKRFEIGIYVFLRCCPAG